MCVLFCTAVGEDADSGRQIASAEVENALYAHPAVSEAIAIGVPDDLLGEKVGVIVAFRPGQSATEAQLMDDVKPR
jgi:long-chain acyl-CoA synthetase